MTPRTWWIVDKERTKDMQEEELTKTQAEVLAWVREQGSDTITRTRRGVGNGITHVEVGVALRMLCDNDFVHRVPHTAPQQYRAMKFCAGGCLMWMPWDGPATCRACDDEPPAPDDNDQPWKGKDR